MDILFKSFYDKRVIFSSFRIHFSKYLLKWLCDNWGSLQNNWEDSSELIVEAGWWVHAVCAHAGQRVHCGGGAVCCVCALYSTWFWKI